MISAVRRICAAASSEEVTVHAESGATAIGIDADSSSAQQRLRRALVRVGWQVEQGRDHRLTVLGWSRPALAHRIRLLTLACLDLREGYRLTVHTAIELAEQYLHTHPGASELEVVREVCDRVDRQLCWTELLEEVEGLPRRCSDPAIAATMTTVLELEASLALLHAEHVMGARLAAEVLWRCIHAPAGPLTSATARIVAWQEAMRLTGKPAAGKPASGAVCLAASP
ncbi:hypothetical protein [Streptosporangium canum]|uniref:hypothetical protein n=1 Tax=Streptosporangium canum TaxID=324952 RepID=UPI0037996417